MDSNQLQELITSLIHYNSKYRLAICKPCGSVLPKNTLLHFRRLHNTLSNIERASIIKYIGSLDIQQPEDISNQFLFETEIDEIVGLPVHELVGCTVCKLLGAESTVIKHCQSEHSWTTGRSKYCNIYC